MVARAEAPRPVREIETTLGPKIEDGRVPARCDTSRQSFWKSSFWKFVVTPRGSGGASPYQASPYQASPYRAALSYRAMRNTRPKIEDDYREESPNVQSLDFRGRLA